MPTGKISTSILVMQVALLVATVTGSIGSVEGFRVYNVQFRNQSDTNQQDPEGVIDDGFIIRALRADIFKKSFLLDQLSLVDSQVAELLELSETYKKETYRTHVQKLTLRSQISSMQSATEVAAAREKVNEFEQKLDRLDKQLLDDIDEILLPHQKRQFKQMLFQRVGLSAGLETFEIPTMVAEKLGLSTNEKKELESLTEKQRKIFDEEKLKFKKQAWEKLISKLPPELVQAIHGRLGAIFNEQAEWFSGLDWIEATSWSQDQWTAFEYARLREFLRRLGNDHNYLPQLGVSEAQSKILRDMILRLGREDSALQKEQRPQRRRGHQLVVEGDDEGKAIEKRLNKQRSKLRQRHIDRMLDDVLVAFQKDRLHQIVRKYRIIIQSSFGDEFGIPYYVADEIGMSKESKKKVFDSIESVRNDFYSNVAELRRKSERSVMRGLTAEQRRKFKDWYGDFYDYRSEVVRSYDEARKANRSKLEEMGQDR